MYNTKTVTNLLSLANFLNKENIKKENIIYLKDKGNGFELLYFKDKKEDIG